MMPAKDKTLNENYISEYRLQDSDKRRSVAPIRQGGDRAPGGDRTPGGSRMTGSERTPGGDRTPSGSRAPGRSVPIRQSGNYAQTGNIYKQSGGEGGIGSKGGGGSIGGGNSSDNGNGSGSDRGSGNQNADLYRQNGNGWQTAGIRGQAGERIPGGGAVQNSSVQHRNTGAPADEAARADSPIRSALMVFTVLAVSLLTLVIFSLSGVEIPFVTAALGGLIGAGSSKSAGGEPDGYTISASVNDGGEGWEGGVPSELMGSGGAWNGEQLLIPSISVSYDISEETEFRMYGNYLAECTRDSFCLIDKEGVEVFRKNVELFKPALYVQSEYLLVSDCGGRAAFVMKGTKLVWEDTFSGGIVNASINKSGFAAFVLDADGYRNSVRALSPTGKMLFDWIVADDYVISAEIAQSGQELVINRLKTTGINICSGLEFLDMQSEPFMSIDSGEEEVFLSARYLDNNFLAVATENAFRLFSENGELLISQQYEAVMAMCGFPSKKASIAALQNNRALVIEYDEETPKGRILYIADKPIINMTADNDYLFINLGHEVTVIKENGDIASHLTLDSEALYGGASEKFGVLVVTKKSADIYMF